MTACPDCRGSGFVQLLTSSVPCTHPSHAKPSVIPARLHGKELKPGEVIMGPGYHAVCYEERVLSTYLGRHAPRPLLCLRGYFNSNTSKIGTRVDLSTVMPVIGEASINEERGMGNIYVCEFESTSVVYHRA